MAGDGHKELNPIAFAVAVIIAPLSMVFGCSYIVDTLPYISALLKGSLAFVGNTEDQQEMAPKGALVHHPKDNFPLWCDSVELFRRYENTIFSHGATTSVKSDIHKRWRIPFDGVR